VADLAFPCHVIDGNTIHVIGDSGIVVRLQGIAAPETTSQAEQRRQLSCINSRKASQCGACWMGPRPRSWKSGFVTQTGEILPGL
jgi:hypothetical protein